MAWPETFPCCARRESARGYGIHQWIRQFFGGLSKDIYEALEFSRALKCGDIQQGILLSPYSVDLPSFGFADHTAQGPVDSALCGDILRTDGMRTRLADSILRIARNRSPAPHRRLSEIDMNLSG